MVVHWLFWFYHRNDFMNWDHMCVHCLAKGNPHFVNPKFSNMSEIRYSDDHGIDDVGFDNHTLASIHCRMSDMHKYQCVHHLMRVWGQAFRRVTLAADGIISFCHNDGIACAYFADCLQECRRAQFCCLNLARRFPSLLQPLLIM